MAPSVSVLTRLTVPWAIKFDYLSIQEILVVKKSPVRTSAHTYVRGENVSPIRPYTPPVFNLILDINIMIKRQLSK